MEDNVSVDEIRATLELSVALLCELNDRPDTVENVRFRGAGFIAFVPYAETNEGLLGTYQLVTAAHCASLLKTRARAARIRGADGSFVFLRIGKRLRWYRSRNEPKADITIMSLSGKYHDKTKYATRSIPDWAIRPRCHLKLGDFVFAIGRDPSQAKNPSCTPLFRSGHVTSGVQKREVEMPSGKKVTSYSYGCDILAEKGYSGSPVFHLCEIDGQVSLSLAGIVTAVDCTGTTYFAPGQRIFEALHHPQIEKQRQALINEEGLT